MIGYFMKKIYFKIIIYYFSLSSSLFASDINQFNDGGLYDKTHSINNKANTKKRKIEDADDINNHKNKKRKIEKNKVINILAYTMFHTIIKNKNAVRPINFEITADYKFGINDSFLRAIILNKKIFLDEFNKHAEDHNIEIVDSYDKLPYIDIDDNIIHLYFKDMECIFDIYQEVYDDLNCDDNNTNAKLDNSYFNYASQDYNSNYFDVTNISDIVYNCSIYTTKSIIKSEKIFNIFIKIHIQLLL